jgi:hypothetical protein
MYVPQAKDFEEDKNTNHTGPWPAVIAQTWEATSYQHDEVNLKVLADGPTDFWRTSVPYSEDKQPGTWHWPEIR